MLFNWFNVSTVGLSTNDGEQLHSAQYTFKSRSRQPSCKQASPTQRLNSKRTFAHLGTVSGASCAVQPTNQSPKPFLRTVSPNTTISGSVTLPFGQSMSVFVLGLPRFEVQLSTKNNPTHLPCLPDMVIREGGYHPSGVQESVESFTIPHVLCSLKSRLLYGLFFDTLFISNV